MRLAMLLAVLCGTATAQSPPPTALRAVRFVDTREGWAAGDHGLVLHSIDGGRTWERQPSGSRAALTGLAFPTPYVGYAVGRTELATGGSSGTVLRTDDAGLTWRECNGTGLPGLNCVQFFDESNGFAAGDSTPSFPASAYQTDDGGRTWTPLPGPRVSRINALACPDTTTGLFMSDEGPLLLRNGRLDPLPTLPGATGAVTACASLSNAVTVVATASGHLHRHDGGWSRAPGVPFGTVHAISAAGPVAVAVGRLGGHVVRSDDQFASSAPAQLPTPVPLHAVHMIDAKLGWAVGELGTIVATADGGKSWQLKRTGGQRAAFLFAHAHANDLPAPLIAKLSQIDGYHCVATLTERGDTARLAAVMAQLGGAGADSTDDAVVPHYLRLAPPDAAQEAARLERLVVALKIWRPAVVVTDSAGPTPLTRAALARMQQAIESAASPTANPAHAARGLAPHTVTKLVTIDPAGDIKVDCHDFVPPLGESLGDYAAPAAALLAPAGRVTRSVSLQVISGPAGDLTAGLALAPGGTARRERVELNPDAAWLKARRDWHDARRDLESLAATATPQARATLVSKLGQLPAPVLATAGVAFAADAQKRGDASFARDLYQLVADRATLETASATAIQWLARHGASSELTRRTELGAFAAPPPAVWEPVAEPAVRLAATLTPRPAFRLRDPETVRNYYLAATEWPARLAAFGPAATRDPFAHLAANAARRKLGRDGDAALNLRALLAADPCDLAHNPVKLRLAEEARLLTPDGLDNPAAPRLACIPSPAPYLDGKLDETAWQRAPAATLAHWTPNSAGERFATLVHATTDGQFLYLAVSARTTVGMKPINMTFDGQDHVEIRLDLDRDYSSYYRIRVASDGSSDCDCTGDSTWKSGHFVAVHHAGRDWSAEIAIPVAALSGTDLWGEVVCLGVTRVVPGVAAGGWVAPTDGTPDPAAMGHLRLPPKPADAKTTASPR